MGLLVRDIEKRAKFYTERLGYEIRSDVVHDPVQTAFVQFLKLPGDASYLEFDFSRWTGEQVGKCAQQRPGA